MTLSRRNLLAGVGTTAGLAIAAPAVWTSARAQAVVTLKLHHFLPAVSNVQAKLLVPWAEQIAADSQGRIKIDMFPSMQLGGRPPQLYDQVRDGVVDVTFTLPGYSSGRFPSTEVFEVPFLASRRAAVNARAAQEFAEGHLAAETKDVKLLSFWAHDHGVLHTNKQIKTMADLKGLKLRNPTRLAGEALKALGAVSVGMPVPQVPESLAQRVIDGAVIPWEVVPAVKVHELVKFHTEIPGSPTLYAATFFLAMNKAKYAAMPADLRDVLDKNSGMAFAARAGRMWDEQALVVTDIVKKRGNAITTISADEKALWLKTCEPIAGRWADEMKAKSIDGGKLLEIARALVAKHEKA